MQNFRKPTFQNVFVQRNPLIVMLIILFFLILVSFLMFILPLVFLHREGISSRVLNSNLYVLHFPSYMILHDASFLFSAIQTLLSPCEAIRAVPAAHKHYTPPSCFLSCFLHVACFFGISTRTVSPPFQGKIIPTVYGFPSFQKPFLYISVTPVLPWIQQGINTSTKCFRGKGIKYIDILRCSIVISFVISHVLCFIICITGFSLVNP